MSRHAAIPLTRCYKMLVNNPSFVVVPYGDSPSTILLAIRLTFFANNHKSVVQNETHSADTVRLGSWLSRLFSNTTGQIRSPQVLPVVCHHRRRWLKFQALDKPQITKLPGCLHLTHSLGTVLGGPTATIHSPFCTSLLIIAFSMPPVALIPGCFRSHCH